MSSNDLKQWYCYSRRLVSLNTSIFSQTSKLKISSSKEPRVLKIMKHRKKTNPDSYQRLGYNVFIRFIYDDP